MCFKHDCETFAEYKDKTDQCLKCEGNCQFCKGEHMCLVFSFTFNMFSNAKRIISRGQREIVSYKHDVMQVNITTAI